MKLENAVIIKSTMSGQTSTNYEDFEAADNFMKNLASQSETKENYRDHEQWYIETSENIGYELRYKEYKN